MPSASDSPLNDRPIIRLLVADSQVFLDALRNPSEPNAKLRAIITRYNALVRDDWSDPNDSRNTAGQTEHMGMDENATNHPQAGEYNAFITAVRQGQDDARAGRVTAHERFLAELDALITAIDAERTCASESRDQR